jgi:hypothetical protein
MEPSVSPESDDPVPSPDPEPPEQAVATAPTAHVREETRTNLR